MTRRLFTVFFIISLTALTTAYAQNPDPGDLNAAVAYAIPLEDITIDGQLDDWSEQTVRYEILNNWNPYGPTDLDGQDLADNDDLSAYFMVGYDSQQDLVYVAVVVRDDHNLPTNPNAHHMSDQADAVEIYFDGRHEPRSGPRPNLAEPERIAAIQYVGVPGDVPAYGNPQGDNPSILDAKMAEDRRTRMAYRREGDTTIYEWVTESFDIYPNVTDLQPSKRIGFDVVVVDFDPSESAMRNHAAWIPFGPRLGAKFMDSSRLAALVFLSGPEALGHVQIQATDRASGEPLDKLWLQAWQGDQPAGEVRTDNDGRAIIALPDGEYTLRPAPGQSVVIEPTSLKVNGDDESSVELSLNTVQIPDALQRAIETYRGMETYQDETITTLRVERPGMTAMFDLSFSLWAAPDNRYRLEGHVGPTHDMVVVSNGKMLWAYAPALWQYRETKIDEPHGFSSGYQLGGLDLKQAAQFQLGSWRELDATMKVQMASIPPLNIVWQALDHDDPVAVLAGNLISASSQPGKLAGQAVDVVDLVVYGQPRLSEWDWNYAGRRAHYRLWIDQAGLIRQSQLSFDGSGDDSPQIDDSGRLIAGSRLVVLNRHEQIQINPTIDDQAFVFTVPDDARLVEYFNTRLGEGRIMPPDQPSGRVTVKAMIDGKSRLVLQGATAQWYHMQWVCPGRYEGADEPTVINGVDWMPKWSDLPDRENTQTPVYSSVYQADQLLLSKNPHTVTVRVLKGRGIVRVVQQPTESNHHTTIIEFEDPEWGAEATTVELAYTETDQPEEHHHHH